MIAQRLKQFIQPPESGDLEELRRGTILEIGAVVFVIAWILMIDSYGRSEQMLVPFLLLGCAVGSVWLRYIDFRAALIWLVGTLIAAIAAQKWFFPDSAVQYFFPLVVVVSSLLVSGVNVFIVAGAAAGSALLVARLLGADWLDGQQVLGPVLLTLMTACSAWIGSRQIHLALDWMQSSYARANELLEQLRDERASLGRTLKMLEEAYVRIEKMNYALMEARSAAETARQLKAEFAANISHELRTPLNLIIGFSETMANAPETYSGVRWSPALRGDIEQIYQSSRHLSSLIDDILDLSALHAQRLGLALSDALIEVVIAEAVAVLQDLFRAKKLELTVDVEQGLPHVRMDVVRIRQVLINLLTNASRFTSKGSVTVRARCVDGEVEVAVQDTGIGIAPRDIPKVFEEFGQVDGSTTRKHEGTGLGVPLSKRLVESHGGRMWLESQQGVGTTFYFALPAASEAISAQTAVATHARSTVPHYRKVVLVRDPDPWLFRAVRRYLTGYDVREIQAGENPAALVEQHQPVALMVNIRDTEAWTGKVPEDLPVIHVALTGNLSAARRLGVESYLPKPVLREQLLDAIAQLDRVVCKVLIVDDDPELVELIARMLQSAGQKYSPIKAFGGADALARLRSEPVDLVLLDLSMPEVDGRSVLAEMKNDPALAHIPAIVISAVQPEAVIESEETGKGDGIYIQMTRAKDASTTEMLSYLQGLLAMLPVRGLPPTIGAPASPPVPAGPPAF